MKLPKGVASLINPAAQGAGLVQLLESFLDISKEISENLRHGHFSHEALGSTNYFGDEQLAADMEANNLIVHHLRVSGLVATISSEEDPVEIDLGGEQFSVGFDPLDGSSIVDANFAVGSIYGVWPGRGLLNRTGASQVCSLVVQYGPRVTMALALNCQVTVSGEAISMELTLTQPDWILSIPKFVIKPSCKTFAPGNLRATGDNSQYRDLVNYWIENKYTLRYSGGLVPDIYHILIKQGGVLSNASSKSAKAKLRLLYECAPIALIIEAAGGASCVCPSEAGEVHEPVSLLEVPISDLDKRVGVCYGSAEEVKRFKTYIFSS
jgi:sedoheptulose-bisphosphatase